MRAAIYLRVSTAEQTPDNQERELRAAAERMGHEVVEVCRDHAVRAARAGTSARASRPCHKDAARRKVDVVMAWSVDRLGRSNLVAFLEHLRETLVFPASAGAGHHHLFAPRYIRNAVGVCRVRAQIRERVLGGWHR